MNFFATPNYFTFFSSAYIWEEQGIRNENSHVSRKCHRYGQSMFSVFKDSQNVTYNVTGIELFLFVLEKLTFGLCPQ